MLLARLSEDLISEGFKVVSYKPSCFIFESLTNENKQKLIDIGFTVTSKQEELKLLGLFNPRVPVEDLYAVELISTKEEFDYRMRMVLLNGKQDKAD